MSALAPTLEAFFSDRLTRQREASPHTVAAYRDTFRLLLAFVHGRTGKSPSALGFDDLDAPLVGAFLAHLEQDRGNGTRTRNARLAAIHSFFRYAAFRHPSRPSGSSAHSSRSSVGRNSRPCWLLPTAPRRPAGVTTPCSCWRRRPACAYPS
jgi:site-specific recombinase XerD